MSAATSKNQLRDRLRSARSSLSEEQRTLSASNLAINLKRLRQYRSSHRIACFIANDSEIETAEVIDNIWSIGKSCFLPVLNQPRIHPLRFAEFMPETILAPNRYGIPEPVVDMHDLFRAIDLDLILMPLVAFDNEGNRIGMGGGYYDRCLQFRHRRQYWRKPYLVGLAYQLQQVDHITADPWDISLDAVVTDQSILQFE